MYSLKVIKNKYLLQMLRKFLFFIPSNYKYNKTYKNNSHETYSKELLNKNSFVQRFLKAISYSFEVLVHYDDLFFLPIF